MSKCADVLSKDLEGDQNSVAAAESAVVVTDVDYLICDDYCDCQTGFSDYHKRIATLIFQLVMFVLFVRIGSSFMSDEYMMAACRDISGVVAGLFLAVKLLLRSV